MDFQMGAAVISNDGENIGTVDALVIDYDTKEVQQIMVKQGMLLTSDRLVYDEAIDRIDDEGNVHLKISAKEVDQLPIFVEEEYQLVNEDQQRMMPHAWVGGVGNPGPLFWTTGHPTTDASPPGEVDTNLPENQVVVSSGTEVVGRDGEKLGTVDEVIYDESGNIQGFVVKAGLIFREDIRVPADWIQTVGSDTVQLSVTADEAESAGGSA